MSDEPIIISKENQRVLRGEPREGGDISRDTPGSGPTPARSHMPERENSIQRSQSFRLPSRSAETPEHNDEVQRRYLESFQVRHEGWKLHEPGTSLRPKRLYRGSELEEMHEDVFNPKRHQGGPDAGRPRGGPQRILANKPAQGERIHGILRSARKTFAVCRGPNTKGPCSACKQLLLELESRDCFLAETESEAEESSSSEADVDLCSGGSGEDNDGNDAGEGI